MKPDASLSTLLFLVALFQPSFSVRIGIIGGGISGTFTTKYLIDHDTDCFLEELTIFDPSPSLGELTTKDKVSDPDNQGSRVGSYQFSDGRIVELGASILTDRFRLIIEMAEGGDLTVGPPFATGLPEENMRNGMAIYNGFGDVLFNTANSSTFHDLAWRYNVDLFKIYRITSTVINRFDKLQHMLNATDDHFFESPVAMWKAVRLMSFVQMSIDQLCDRLWLPKEIPWWRRILFSGQGSLRTELLESMMLVNYNQGNSQINALAGLASFSATSHSKVHSIAGGNAAVIHSAFDQARSNRAKKCPEKADIVSHSSQKVETVVGSLEGFEVYAADGTMVGEYDILILATPLSMARIEFLVKSSTDQSILQPMPLGGLVENQEDTVVPDDHEGHLPLPHHLSEAAIRTYTQVVTTLVRHAELQVGYFNIDPAKAPRGIYMTRNGKAAEHNVTAIAQISSKDGVYKVFSSQPLPLETLRLFFGSPVEVEHEKVWGGKFG